MKRYLYFAFAAIAMTACNEEVMTEKNPSVNSELPLFEATAENPLSRIELTESLAIHWKENDRISVFAHSTANTEYQLDEGINSTNGKFRPLSAQPAGGTPLYLNGALYPFHTENTVKGNGTLGLTFTLNIPQSQTYTKDSFDPSAFPMVAVTSNTSLAFKNVCGALMLQLTGNGKLASVSISGNNQEPLAGNGTIEMPLQGLPTWKASTETTTVTLDCSQDGGIPLSDTPAILYLSLPPVTFSSGFNIVLTDTQGYQMSLQTSKAQSIVRNEILKMPVVPCVFTQPPLQGEKTLTITHHLKHFVLPDLPGISTDGKINWGDNSTDSYQPEAGHSYSTEGPHTVSIGASQTQTVSFKSLKGISRVDFSKF